MKEINRHILINGISDLPEYKAPEGLWDNIDTSLFSISGNNLPVHKPSPQVWAAVESEIAGSFFSKKLVKISLLVLLLILLFGYSYDYFNTNYSSNSTSQISNPKSNSNMVVIAADDFTDEAEVQETHADISSVEAIDQTIELSSIINYNEPNESKQINESFKEHSEIIPISNINKPLVYQQTILPRSLNPTYFNNYRPLSASDMESAIDKKRKILAPVPQYCDFNRIEKNIFIGPGAEYQYFFNSSFPENTTMIYWISGDLRFKYKRESLSFETGIGISYSEDKANFSYDYLTNELVDTYEYVDSVHYDPITGTTEYFTTTVEVFDSIPHSSSSSVEKQYAYLQIPLFIGYDIYKTRNFCVNIVAGVVFNTEITKKDYLPTIYHDDSRITYLGTNNIERNKQIINISGRIGFNWHISNKINLMAEPSFNYYSHKLYKNYDELKKPMSIGIRFGLYFKL